MTNRTISTRSSDSIYCRVYFFYGKSKGEDELKKERKNVGEELNVLFKSLEEIKRERDKAVSLPEPYDEDNQLFETIRIASEMMAASL